MEDSVTGSSSDISNLGHPACRKRRPSKMLFKSNIYFPHF